MVPFPYNRDYEWLRYDEPFTYTEVRGMFKRLRDSAQKWSPRYATYALMLETIDALNHERGIEEFPRLKVHKLLINAAERCDWYCASPGEKKAPSGPDGTRYCRNCKEYKPHAEFKRVATEAERRKYHWNSAGRLRYVATVLCTECRNMQTKAKVAREKRRQQRKDERELANIIRSQYKGSRDVRQRIALTYSVLKVQIDAGIQQTKEVLTTEDNLKQQFYLERLYCLEQAKAELERRVENGEPLPENNPADETPTPHWSRLLSEEDYRRLNDKYMHFVSSPGRKGRTPQI